MSDIYIPGVNSKVGSDKLIENLMKVERVPKERAEKNVESLKTQKTIWQDVGRRMTALRESARSLYSFQNPFNERVVESSNEAALTGTATREASEQKRTFTVKQAASADRFLSAPLAEDYKVKQGSYSFAVGEERISFDFKGGSLKDFVDALNRRGKDKIRAELIAVEPGTKSLILASQATGEKNRLSFADAAEALVLETGIAERIDSQARSIDAASGAKLSPAGPADATKVSIQEEALRVAAGGSARIPLSPAVRPTGDLTLEYEISVSLKDEEETADQGPPAGPQLPSTGGITYGGITIENDPFAVPAAPWTPPPRPQRVDDPSVLSLTASDGSSIPLPQVADGTEFRKVSVRLADLAAGKGLNSLDLVNRNTHRDVSIRAIRIYDPSARDGSKPKNPVSTAADAVLVMDGIEVRRPSNDIGDLIPGVTLTVHGKTDGPVDLTVKPDLDAVKEAVIGLVGNYNRLMAEANVLTRNDDRIVQELSYLDKDEQKDMQDKLGALQGDSTLNQFKSSLQRSAATPYSTSADKEMTLLSQLGISTDARRTGGTGYDASRLRGYLEIDEKTLDAALAKQLPAIKELFGKDSDGDLVIDSGFAYTVDSLLRPYVETGGIIALKTGGIDSRISQEQRRIETLDVQLANKESDLKRQYGLMEGALNRMDRTSTSIDQFSQRSSNN